MSKKSPSLFNSIFGSIFGAACDVGLSLENRKRSSRLDDDLSSSGP